MLLLTLATLSLAFVHTVLGPDHYLPFIAVANIRRWSATKLLFIIIICGLLHVLSAIVLAAVGLFLGLSILSLKTFAKMQNNLVAFGFLGFGLFYFIFSLYKFYRNKKHCHLHQENLAKITPWVVFTIFIFGPCEPFIPLFIYAYFKGGIPLAMGVSLIFTAATILTILGVVFFVLQTGRFFNLKGLNRYRDLLAASILIICGLGVFLGL